MALKLPGEAKKKKQKEKVFKPYSKNLQSKKVYSKNRQTIRDIAQKAREKDLSYGEYVARYECGL